MKLEIFFFYFWDNPSASIGNTFCYSHSHLPLHHNNNSVTAGSYRNCQSKSGEINEKQSHSVANCLIVEKYTEIDIQYGNGRIRNYLVGNGSQKQRIQQKKVGEIFQYDCV